MCEDIQIAEVGWERRGSVMEKKWKNKMTKNAADNTRENSYVSHLKQKQQQQKI